jgi:hypothetical protein
MTKIEVTYESTILSFWLVLFTDPIATVPVQVKKNNNNLGNVE